MPTLDAHVGLSGPLQASDLMGYKDAEPPREEQEAMQGRKVMRRARSRKKRGLLLTELEARYLATP